MKEQLLQLPIDSILEKLGIRQEGRPTGGWRTCNPCPIKGDSHENKGFRVNEDGGWCCFACDQTGDRFHLVGQVIFGNRHAFKESCEWLGEQFGIEVKWGGDNGFTQARRDEESRIYKIFEDACDYWSADLQQHAGMYRLLRKKYGLSQVFVDAWKIGYASGKGLLSYLQGKGHSERDLEASGLFWDLKKGTEYFAGRLVFPYWRNRFWTPEKTRKGEIIQGHAVSGSVVYLAGRELDAHLLDEFNLPASLQTSKFELSRGQKYKKLRIHSENNETISPVIHNNWLMGESPMPSSSAPYPDTLFVVEGSVDPLPMIEYGFPTISTGGTKVTDELVKKIIHMARGFKYIILIPDQDSGAGRRCMDALAARLSKEGLDPCLIVLPTQGEEKMDPARFFATMANPVKDLTELAARSEYYGATLLRELASRTTFKGFDEFFTQMAPFWKDRSMLQLAFYYDELSEILELKGSRAREIKKRIFSLAKPEDLSGNPSEDQLRRMFVESNPHWKYDPAAGSWMRYTGRHWKPCRKEEMKERLLHFADEPVSEDGTARVPKGYSAHYIEGVQRQLQWSQPQLVWNDNPLLIPFENGVLDLRFADAGIKPKDVRLMPHNKEYKNTWCLPYEFDPNATCPTIDKYLLEVTSYEDEDGYIHFRPEAVKILMAFMAATIRGMGADLQIFLEVVGPGGSGKGTFCNLVRDMIGHENVFQTLLDQLEEDKFVAAEIVGKKIMMVTDSEQFVKKAERLRMITGGDSIPLRKMREQPEGNYQPHCTTLIASNSPIRPRDPYGALERRRVTVPFYRQNRSKQMISDLRLRLRREIPGLINKLLQMPVSEIWGCLKGGAPALAEVRREHLCSDLFGAFVHDRIVYDPGATTFLGAIREVPLAESEGRYFYDRYDEDLYPAYLQYCRENSPNMNNALINTSFCGQLEAFITAKLELDKQSFEKKRTSKGYFWKNIAVRRGDKDTRPSLFDISEKTTFAEETEKIPSVYKMEYETLAQFIANDGANRDRSEQERQRAMNVMAQSTPIMSWGPEDKRLKPSLKETRVQQKSVPKMEITPPPQDTELNWPPREQVADELAFATYAATEVETYDAQAQAAEQEPVQEDLFDQEPVVDEYEQHMIQAEERLKNFDFEDQQIAEELEEMDLGSIDEDLEMETSEFDPDDIRLAVTRRQIAVLLNAISLYPDPKEKEVLKNTLRGMLRYLIVKGDVYAVELNYDSMAYETKTGKPWYSSIEMEEAYRALIHFPKHLRKRLYLFLEEIQRVFYHANLAAKESKK